jgi:AdoMet-dependent heme synthase
MQRSRYPFRQEVFGGIQYDPKTEDYFFLNKSAFAVLALLDEPEEDDPLPAIVQDAVKRMQAQGLLQDSDWRMRRGKLVHDRANVLSAPTIVEIYPNFTCNERCEFCYVGNEVESASPANALRREQVPLLAQKLAEAGVFNVTVLGGEPFLYHSLDFLVEQLATRALDVSLSTNGTVLNRNFLNAMKQYAVKLNVAIHGPDAETHDRVTRSNSFAKVTRFLEETAGVGIEAHITTVLHPLNMFRVDETVRLVGKLGAKSMTLSYPQPARYARKHGAIVAFPEYVARLRRAIDEGSAAGVRVKGSSHYNFLLKENDSKFGTRNPLSRLLYGDKAGRSRLEMVPSGDLYPSSAVFEKPEFKVGNVFEDDLLEAWADSPVLERIRERQLPAPCRDCPHEPVCGGGIIGERLAEDHWDLPPEDCPVLEGYEGQPTSLNR